MQNPTNNPTTIESYWVAFALVDQIESNLRIGYHYRDTQGRLLTTLDQIVRAILADLFPCLPLGGIEGGLTGGRSEGGPHA